MKHTLWFHFVLAGHGCLFLFRPHKVKMGGRLKMGYSDGVHDSRAWCPITHFKVTTESPLLQGETKKDTHVPPQGNYRSTGPLFLLYPIPWSRSGPSKNGVEHPQSEHYMLHLYKPFWNAALGNTVAKWGAKRKMMLMPTNKVNNQQVMFHYGMTRFSGW